MKEFFKNRRFEAILGGIAIGICILAASTLTITFSNDSEEDKIVVLDNQQQEIQDALFIEDIESVEGFRAQGWISETEVIGLTSNNGNCLIAVYDLIKGELREFMSTSVVEEKTTLRLSSESIHQGYNKVVYQLLSQYDGRSKYDIRGDMYILNIESGESSLVDSDVEHICDDGDSKILYTKEVDVYELDLSTSDIIKIEFPDELLEALEYVPSTYEEYYETYSRVINDDNIEYFKDYCTKTYEYIKDKKGLEYISTHGNKIILDTYGNRHLFYYPHNKSYEEIFYRDPKVKRDYPYSMMNGPTKRVKYEDGREEFWVVDINSKGEDIELLGDETLYEYLSPDHSKMVYVVKDAQDNKSVFIYDFETSRKAPIFNNIDSEVIWEKDSKGFLFCTSDEGYIAGPENITTNIIRLNE